MRALTLLPLAAALLVAGCASSPAAERVVTPVAVAPQRIEYGSVEAIEWTRDGTARPVRLGAIVGGFSGDVVGHEVGSVPVAAATPGSAWIGDRLDPAGEGDRYRVVVRLDDGGTLALSEVGEGQLRVGDRVRIIGDRAYRV